MDYSIRNEKMEGFKSRLDIVERIVNVIEIREEEYKVKGKERHTAAIHQRIPLY